MSTFKYANCRFEDLLPEHFLKLMMVTAAETIMRKREASRPGNLGTPAPRYDKYQGRDLHLPEGSKNKWHREGEGTKWQRKELGKEIKSNATVASAGDIAELQETVGDYQNTTKYFTKKNKVYCAPIREHAQAACKNCGKSHYIDTFCKGGDAFKPTPANERHSSCPLDMAKAMYENNFMRLMFRFQGGKGGLPKATTGEEAVAADAVVTVALGTAKKQSQEAGKAKRRQKAKEKREKKAEEEASDEEDAATENL